MAGKIKSRLILLGVFSVTLAALAAAPRPARPAIPARPVQQSAAGGLAGKILLVDAGHGGRDGGARARDSGVWEKEINLQTALRLRDALRQAGAEVIMTRETDRDYARGKRDDLNARLTMADGADLIISVHMNEYRSRKESGPQVFYRRGQEQSRLLAGAVQDALIRVLAPARERAAMAGDYYILSLDRPSILVECGFLSNPQEEKLLLSEDYQEKIARAICEGVTEYFTLFPDGQTAEPVA